jgi:AcrB/AcrD/AcrF family
VQPSGSRRGWVSVWRDVLASLRFRLFPNRARHYRAVVPLAQIATFEYAQEYPIVWRRNRVPTMTVQADVVPGLMPATAVRAVQPGIDRLAATLPTGYQVVAGGSVEESAKAKVSVQAVLPMMLVLILTILMFQLQSFQRVLLVLSVAPLGLIGVVAALLLAQAPLGFVATSGAAYWIPIVQCAHQTRGSGFGSPRRGRERPSQRSSPAPGRARRARTGDDLRAHPARARRCRGPRGADGEPHQLAGRSEEGGSG